MSLRGAVRTLLLLALPLGLLVPMPGRASSPGLRRPLPQATPILPEEGPQHVMRELPIESFSHMVVDHKRKQVFVTGGYGVDKIVVLDYEARIVEAIRNEPGASGMVIHDGKLYVLLLGKRAIDVIDLSSLERVRRHRLPAKPMYQVGWATSGQLEKAGGRLWFLTRGCHSYWKGVLQDPTTTFDLRTHEVKVRALAKAGGVRDDCPVHFVSGGPKRDFVYAYQTWVYGDMDGLHFTLGGDGPRLRRRTVFYGHGTFHDAAVSPDGRLVYLANSCSCGNDPYRLEVQALRSGRMRGSYNISPYPRAVELSRDGETIVVGHQSTSEGEPDVAVFRKGQRNRPVFTYDIGEGFDYAVIIEEGALGLTPSARRGFAVGLYDPGHNYERLYFFSMRLSEEKGILEPD